ncbi:MAG: T9SS type A sorting domain-containing protein [Bacteroidetes bacterium]|nr:T9SS type A sorting domain-containing protein [Bacteroidota bacterium]
MKKSFVLFSVIVTLATSSFAQGAWSQKASMGGLARHRPFTFSIGLRGYLGCGWNGVTMYSDFWEYDPASNSWQQKADYPAGPRLSAFGFSIGNKGYAGTGLDEFLYSQSDFYEYNPITNSWSAKASFPGTPMFASSATVVGTKGYVCFGDDWDLGYMRYNNLWEYNPSTNSWASKSPCPGFPRRDAVAFTIGTKAYFGTGNDDSYLETSDFWEYSPATDTWTQKANFAGSDRSQAVGFAINGKGYIGTGGQLDVQDFFEYDPITNSWTGVDNFPGSGRENSASLVIDNRAYVTCGTSGINYRDLWEFNPFMITKTNEHPIEMNISVYPNPMSDRAIIEIITSKNIINATWQLLDDKGKEVASEKIFNLKFELSKNNLASGIYLLNIKNDQKIIASKKIIIQ